MVVVVVAVSIVRVITTTGFTDVCESRSTMKIRLHGNSAHEGLPCKLACFLGANIVGMDRANFT